MKNQKARQFEFVKYQRAGCLGFFFHVVELFLVFEFIIDEQSSS